jgi:predicted Zn-ribbon and HTH transcriptional regulator
MPNTTASVNQEIINFYNQNGRRPTQKDLPSIASWLRRRDKTLLQQCAEVGLCGA